MKTHPEKNRPMTSRRDPVITVGQGEGDIQGKDDKILQAGIEYLHRLGGGVLHILPGEYTMRNALHMRPGVHIRGSGPATTLKKAPSVVASLIQDSDWFEARVRVDNPEGFSAGGGVMLRAYYDAGPFRMMVVRDTITAIEGDTLSLSRRLEHNMWPSLQATASTLFPLITAEYVNDITIENLVLDGNREHNEEINGNYAGGVFIQHCDRYTFRNVISRNYSGDGFSFQVCDDIHFEDCRSENNAHLGFHPGSGSQRPVIRRCVSRGNSQGIFFCWGVSDGLVEDCVCSDNLDYGITIGHRDTDNRIVRTEIERNARAGVQFRDESSPFLAGHRTLIEYALIRDNGFREQGVGIDLRDGVCATRIENCRIEDTGKGLQKIGVRIGSSAGETTLRDNTFAGLETDLEDLRKRASGKEG